MVEDFCVCVDEDALDPADRGFRKFVRQHRGLAAGQLCPTHLNGLFFGRHNFWGALGFFQPNISFSLDFDFEVDMRAILSVTSYRVALCWSAARLIDIDFGY